MPVRVTAGGSVNVERIAAGINWATEHGARIINVSLSHVGAPDSAEAQAVQNAIDRGVVVVASAGNLGTEAPQYPGAYPGVLAVGATDDTDALYFWSSRGPWVALTAPGCHMVVDATTPPGTICGTSFTPAAVSGVAGLLLSRNPSLTANQVRGALTSTARPVPGVAFGRIDPVAAFQLLGLSAAVVQTPVVKLGGSPGTSARPVPGQLYTRQTLFETGTFRRGFRTSFKVGRGRFEIQLLTPLARDCELTVRSPAELIVAAPALKNLLSISVQVAGGRYTAAVTCRGVRSRQYSLGVIAMFPRGK